MKRIRDKIKEIELFLDQLKDFLPSSLEEYESSLEKKAVCERYAEKIIEAVTDLAFLVIKHKKFRLPQDDIDAFSILLGEKIISDVLTKKLQEAKGMRNIIAHQYGKIDDQTIFNSLTQELENDVKEFIKEIKKVMK